MRWAARSVIPTRSAMSRIRIPESLARHSRTAAWFVTKVQDPLGEDVLNSRQKSRMFRNRSEPAENCPGEKRRLS